MEPGFSLVRFIKNVLVVGGVFGVGMGVFFGISQGAAQGVGGGLLSGVLFGLIIAVFMEAMHARTRRVAAAELKDEHVLRGGLANRMVPGEGVGGWLFLTRTGLYFVPHAFNAQREKATIAVKDIEAVTTHRTAGIIPNGLRVTTAGGEESFVVNRNKRWKKAIEQASHSGSA